MASQPTVPPLPGREWYRIADGKGSWTESNSSADSESAEPALEALEEDIVFVTKPHDNQSGFVVYTLKEQVEDKENPFQLGRVYINSPPQSLEKYLVTKIPNHLDRGDVYIIISTGSGIKQAEFFFDAVLQPLLTELGLSPEGGYETIRTQSAQTIREFARGHWGTPRLTVEDGKASSETVILLSGDGGVVDLLNGGGDGALSSRGTSQQPTIAVLPLGTGNALFHSIHRPLYKQSGASAYVQGLRTLFAGAPAPLPTFRASFSPGSKLISYTDPGNSGGGGEAPPASGEIEEHTAAVDHLFGAIVASYGFHAQLVWESDTPEYRKHGAKRFGMAAESLLKESHAYDAAVEVRRPGDGGAGLVALGAGGGRQGQKFNYVLATLVSSLEKTFTISPASAPLDGRLRLVHFGAVGGAKTMEIMMAAYKDGAHVGMSWTAADGKEGEEEEKVGYDEIEELRVAVREEDARWRKVCIDGTIVDIPAGGAMTVKTVEQPLLRVLVAPGLV